jgi:hypothetical protein
MHRGGFLVLAFATACGPTSSSATSSGTSSASGADTSSSAAPAASASSAPSVGSGTPAASSRAGDAAPADSASAAAKQADPSHLVLERDPIQGGVVFAKTDLPVDKIEFPGHREVVGDDGAFVVAFFRNAPKREKMIVHFEDGSVLEHVFDVAQRTFPTDEINGLPDEMVNPDAKTKRELAADAARIEAIRMKSGSSDCYEQPFAWPAVAKITSRYGETRVLDGTDGGIHWGVDIAVPNGTPVKAPACGTVVFAEKDLPLSGSTVIVDHGHGITSTFIHLSKFEKKVGDEVKQGDVVARSGHGGRATGAHLDWRMNYYEIRIDPELVVPPMPAR